MTTADTTKMTVSELREKIVEFSDMTEEDVQKIKGKSKLSEVYNNVISDDKEASFDFSDVEETVEIVKDVAADTQEEQELHEDLFFVPDYTSPEWQNYVMSQFTEDELQDGMPKLPALRRVTGLLLGEIVDSGPISQTLTDVGDVEAPPKASAIVEVKIVWSRDVAGRFINVEDSNFSLPVRTFRASGGSCIGNTNEEFAMFPEAMAENRAESRALRKALNIVQVTHEEVTDKDTKSKLQEIVERRTSPKEDKGWNGSDSATQSQKDVIVAKSAQLQVSPDDLIQQVTDGNFVSINDLTREVAGDLISKLNKLQQGTI